MTELSDLIPAFNLSYKEGEAVTRVKAGIAANFGSAWDVAGDVCKAYKWHVKSLGLYKLLRGKGRRIGIDESRQEMNVATMLVRIASFSKHLEWIGKVSDGGEEFWRDVKKGEGFGDVVEGYDQALLVFYHEAYRLRMRGDWIGFCFCWLNVAGVYVKVKKPIATLYYLSLLVSRTEIPALIQCKILWVLVQALFVMVGMDPRPEIPSEIVRAMQDFMALTVDCDIMLDNLSTKDVTRLCEAVKTKIGNGAAVLRLPSVIPSSRISHHVDGEVVNGKIDGVQAEVYGLSILVSKMEWISQDYEVAIRTASTATSIALGLGKISVPTTFLLQLAHHFSTNSLQQGSISVLKPHHFLYLADLLGFVKLNGLEGAAAAGVPMPRVAEVRKGLIEGGKLLILEAGAWCGECGEVGCAHISLLLPTSPSSPLSPD